MALKDEILEEAENIFGFQWTSRDGYVVPAPGDIKLTTNDAVKFDSVVVLYADLKASTQMVDAKKPSFAAEVYRGFLAAAARVIRHEGGEITAYDGDRIMAVFLDDEKESHAARCGLKINYAVKKIVTPTLQKYWSGSTFEVKHVVGIDVSPMFVARTGIRGGNDLVWVGRAANYAAKLCNLGADGHSTYVTDRVFEAMTETTKYGGNPRQLMWESRTWTDMNKISIYRSSWTWSV